MERTEILDMMGGLKLYGMKSAYDEMLAMALKRKHEPQRFVGDLLKAEISEKQARSIKYQLTVAKLPLAVNGAAIFLKSGAAKFPSLAGWRSAVCAIGASVLWRPSAALQGRRDGLGGGVRLEPDGVGQEVGVLAQPVARPFDLDDDGVVQQSVQ